MDKVSERPASQATCSSPTGQAPAGLGASRVDQAQLLALAKRCEAIAERDILPLTTLNGDILTAYGWTSDSAGVYAPNGQRSLRVPDVVRSIDDAAALVPVEPFPNLRPGQWWWSVDSLGCDAHVAYENHDCGIPEYSGSAATPALALCAAALRATSDMVR